MRILLAEDAHELGEWITKALRELSYYVDWVDDGLLVENTLRREAYDALILDLGLPGIDGHTVLHRLRAADQRLPVLVLTARDSLREKVKTLNEGADDFLIKPFAVEELAARLTALIRRSRGLDFPRFSCGPLQLDAVTRQFSVHAQQIALSPREYSVLRVLIAKSGQPLSKHEILFKAFQDGEEFLPSLVEVIIHRLRKRLEGSGVRIVTMRGLGYVLEPFQEPEPARAASHAAAADHAGHHRH